MKSQKKLNFKRTSQFSSFDFEDSLRSAGKFKDEDINFFLQVVRPRDIIRQSGDSRRVGDILNIYNQSVAKNTRESFVQMIDHLRESYDSYPYTLAIMNMTTDPIIIVWAYKLYSGSIVIQESNVIQPRQMVSLNTSVKNVACNEIKEYAFSVVDTNYLEHARFPTTTVAEIDEDEKKRGMYKECADSFEIYEPK